MTVYEIPNIEHCTVTPVMSGETVRGYRIAANEGWYIHLNDGDEETENLWKTYVVLQATYNFEQVIIVAEADLPEGAEICGGVEPETEVM